MWILEQTLRLEEKSVQDECKNTWKSALTFVLENTKILKILSRVKSNFYTLKGWVATLIVIILVFKNVKLEQFEAIFHPLYSLCY